MEVTNIKEEGPQKEHVIWSFARWFAVWLAIYLVVGAVGGLFRSSPRDIPAGMSWVNSADFASSTFYMLRGGPHLILQLNLHSQRWIAMLFTGMAVMFMYLVGQALQGRLKNRQKEELPPWQQKSMAVVCAGMVLFLLWYGTGSLLKKQTLDLDPADDSVLLNGGYVSSFKAITGFQSYITHGSKGSINYHLEMESVGQPPLPIAGTNPHSDVQQVAGYLNAYLAEVRREASPP